MNDSRVARRGALREDSNPTSGRAVGAAPASPTMAFPTPRCAAAPSNVGGFTLLEVLIALVVLSIGILGLVSLQTLALQHNTGTYYQSQAAALADDLLERMRANRQAALNDLYEGSFEDAPPPCDPDLTGGTPEEDVAAWRSALACRLPLGTGAVTRDGETFVITVRWDNSRGRGTPDQLRVTTAL